jgi:hypothetical protein
MTTFIRKLLVLVLLLASSQAIFACTECSSLTNNDNLPQGDYLLLLKLWSGEDYRGNVVGIPEGYVSVSFGWKFRSVQVPDGYEVLLFEEDSLMGAYVVISSDTPSIDSLYFNGRTKSLKYIKKDGTSLKHPDIFSQHGFAGKRHILPFGITNLPELENFGSLKIPAGVSVKLTTVYGPRFLKREIVLTSDSEQLLISDPVESIYVSIQTPPDL